MANDFQKMLDFYTANPSAKRAEVAATADAKKQSMAMPTAQDYRNASLIGQKGYGSYSATEIERDLATLAPIQLDVKYGPDVAKQFSQGMVDAGNKIYRQRTGDRSILDMADDTVNDVGSAVVNSAGNLTALAVSPFSARAASSMTSLLDQFNNYSHGLQSESLNDRREVQNDILKLAQRDTTLQHEQRGGGLVSSLQAIGAEVIDTVTVGSSDSQTLLSGVAQGVGSMFGIGPLGKAISKGAGVSRTVGTMGAIGLQGAGGARTQAAQEAQAALANRTDLTQDEKYQLENEAGLKAAAIAGPASMLLGKLVAKFEADPLAKVGLRTAMGNVRNETIEEGLQSASEQLGVNTGIQTTVDPNRSMSAGVGETMGLGALYGAGTAGVMSGPGLTRGAVADTGAAIGKAAKAAGSFLQKRADAVVAQNEAASPVSQTRVNDAIDASVTALTPEVMAAVPEADSEYVRSLVQAVAFDPAELVQAGAPAILIEAVGDANTRVKAIQRMSAVVSNLDPETDPDFLASAYALNDQITRFNQVVDSDPAAWEAMPEDHPTVSAVRAVDDAVARAMQSPALIQANNKIMESMAKVPTPQTVDLSEAALATPEGQKAVQDNLMMAEIAPDRGNLEMTQKILKHAEAGLLNIPPQQLRALKVAEGLLQAVQDAHSSGNYMGLDGVPFTVSQDILTEEKARKKDHDSALSYTNQVLGAMRLGRPEQAKMALENFMEFVTHMNNKVDALGRHYNEGNWTRETGLYYEARLAPGKFGQSADKVWVNPNAPKSMRQVRAIEREADTLRKIANAMATAYPELEVAMAPRVLLPDAISSVKNKQAETASAPATQAAPAPTAAPAAPSVLEVNRAKITPDPVQGKSKYTPAQAAKMDPEKLNDELGALTEKVGKRTPDEEATFEVLNAQMTIWENEAAEKYTREEAEAEAREEAAKTAKQKAYQDSFEMPSQSVLAKKPTPASIDNWSNPVEWHGKTVYTNGHFIDVTGTPPHLKNWESRKGVLQNLTTSTIDRVLGMAGVRDGFPDNSHVKADPLAVIDDAKSGRLFFDVQGELVGIDLKYARYFHSKVKGVTFTANPKDLGGPLRVMDGDNLVGIVMPIRYDKSLKMTVADVRGYMASSGKSDLDEAMAREWEAALANQAEIDAQEDARTIPEDVVEQAVESTKDKELSLGEQERLDAAKAKTESKPEAKVEPEVQEEEDDATEVAEINQSKKSLTEIFSGLINRPHMPNRFWTAYRVNTKNMSRLLGVPNAVEFVRDALTNAAAFVKATGSNPTVRLDEEIRQGYDDLLSFAASWKQNMNQNLQDLVAGKKEKTDKDRIRKLLNGVANDNGKVNDILGFDNLRALSLTEETVVNGVRTLKYNENLVDAVTMAGLQWLLQGEKRSPQSFDEREASKILGIDENQVSSYAFEMLSGSLTNLQLVNDLATRIKSYWGVQGKNDQLLGDSDGIAMNAALELISAMIKDGVLTRKTLKFNSSGELYAIDDNYTGLKLKNKEKVVPVVTYTITELDYKKPYFKYPNALDDIILSEPEKPFFLDRERPRVPETQMRNPYVRNTPEQMKASQNEAATPFRLNTIIFDFYTSLGEEGITALYGPGEVNENNTNVNDLETKRGQIKSRLDAFKRLRELHTQLTARAEFLGLTPEEIDVRFNYNMSRVGRMQQLGPFGPQASKLVREALLPTESTLDLNDKNGDGYKMWVLGLAQAMGVKVHTKSLANSEIELMNILGKPEMVRALDGVRAWQEGGRATEDMIANLREAFGGPVTEVAMHALMDYVRYQLASEADRAKFKTFVYVEADGVTNGPINAMMLMSVGAFDTNWVKVMKKGGLWIGRNDMTMNKHRESGNPEDKVDTYEQAAINMATSQTNLKSNIEMFANHKDKRKKTAVPKENLSHLNFLLGKFLSGAKINEAGDLVIDRGAMKNPLTITIYGSGAKGIAGKIFTLMSEAIYAKMSEALVKMGKYEDMGLAQAMFGGTPEQASAEARKFLAAINALSARHTYYNSKFDYWAVKEDENFQQLRNVNPLSFTFTWSQADTMTNNILNLFVKPMRAGISETMGAGLDIGSKMIRDATQVHSLVLADAFQRALQEKIAARKAADPNYKQNDFISPKEIKELFGPLAQLSPLVRTAVQTYFVAGSQSVMENNSRITSDFDGQARVEAFIPGPANSGVSGIPYLTIGTGDGMMMQILATMKDGVSKTMKVFDGMNIALDQVVKGSQQANQAVWESWQGNPLAAVSEMYQGFLADADLDSLSTQTITDLARVFRIDEESSDLDFDIMKVIQGEMQNLGRRIKAGALSVEARHLAISKFNLSVDQMASAGAPHNHKGGIDGSQMSDEDVVTELNKIYEEEFAKLVANEKASKTSEEISKDLEGVGTELKSGVRSLPLTALRKLAKVVKIPESQMDALTQVLRVLAPRGYKVIAGTPAQLLKYIADKKMAKLSGTDAQALLEGKIGGWTHMRSKTVFVANGSSETLVHELVHAATIDTIYAHYSGQDLGEKGVAVRHAISNLEKLMAQFMQMGPNLSATDVETRTAYANAVAAIEEYNQDSGLDSATARTKALNEFMAWGLTNQKLVRAMKRTEASPLVRLAQRVVQAIKQLIWGSVEIPAVGNDMFSNLMFNSAMVMELSPSVKAAGVTGIAKHSVQQNGRIQALNQAAMALLQDIPTHIVNSPGNYSQVRNAQNMSALVLNNAKAHGFAMTGAEQSTFLSTLAALGTEAKFNSNVLLEASRLYDHVTKNLKVEDLMVNPDSTNPNDFALATSQYNFLMGTFGTQTDTLGRSTLLSSFVALASVNEDLRRALDRIALPEKLQKKWGTLNDSLETIGLQAMESLRTRMVKIPEGSTLTGMDALVDQLIQSAQQGESRVEQEINKVGSMIDSANDYVVQAMQSLSQKAVNMSEKLYKAHTNSVTNKLNETVKLAAAMVNENQANLAAESVLTYMNRTKMNDAFRSFMNDLIGRTASNATVVDMVKWVRNRVQATRQQYRENLPSVIMKQFSRPMTEEEMTVLYRALGKTDLAALGTSASMQEVFDVIADDKKMLKQIKDLEQSIEASDKKHWSLIQSKSKQLANYLNTGKPGPVLLRNAYAISRLFGLVDQSTYSDPTAQTISEIDKLVSLYALQSLDAQTRKTLKEIVASEQKGVHFMLSYMNGQRQEELRKSSLSMAQANHYKGYIPSVQTANGNVIVADDSRYVELISQGYTLIGDYQGSSLDTRSKRSYYYIDVNPKSPFSQGLIQHVRQTSGGVDVSTGYTMGNTVAGVIRDPYTVKRMAAQMSKERAVEHMLPVFDDSGKVVAFERSVDPDKLAALAQDTNAARMIGVWRGRQVEEVEGQITNEILVERLYDMYVQGRKEGRKDEFVDVFKEADDKVTIDAMRLINPQVRDMIKSKFGDQFMVNRGLLNDVLGYREASVGDAWTGVTRWSQNTMDQVRNLGMAVFGNQAYRYMVNTETTLQNYVKDARVLIVVKSVIVPAANLASNILQLVARGVPMARILRDIPKKVVEVNEYAKTRLRKIEAEAELMAAKDDVVKSRKLTAEIKAIDDSHRRMSIWPLIEAGEFSAISDAGISREDIMLTEGRLNAYIESLTDKLPQEVKTLGKYAVIAKDTALFQGLQKAVEYGDFLGKAVIYDHLTQTKKMDSKEALSQVSEEFINYDRLPGRTRGALENNGFLWFYNFKIRSVKVAASIIRNNPLHALLAMGAADTVGLDQIGLGTPVQDNLLAVVGDGRLGYSMGLGQGLHALSLNPWVNLMN